MSPTRKAPRLTVRPDTGGVYAYFYDPAKLPARKRVAIGHVLSEGESQEIPKEVEDVFYREYMTPYMAGLYDPWAVQQPRMAPTSLIEAIVMYCDRPDISEDTRTTDHFTLEHFRTHAFGGKMRTPSLDVVTPEMLSAYIYREGTSSAYRASMYTRLRAAFNWFVAQGLTAQNPIEKVKQPRRDEDLPVFLMPDEAMALSNRVRTEYFEKLSRQFDGSRGGHIGEDMLIWVDHAFMLGLSTMLRPRELRSLKLKHVDLHMGRLVVRGRTKTRRERVVPLCPLAERTIEEAARGKRDDDYVILSPNGNQIDTRRLARLTKAHLVGLGHPDLDFYSSTRHTGASWLSMLGYPVDYISSVLGHANLSTTQVYMHFSPSAFTSRWKKEHRRFAESCEKIGFFDPYAFGLGE
jgi:integrase